VIHTAGGTIDVPVAPLSVASHQPVDPPHDTALQWNTAAWIVQSANPARPSAGTAYIYGHACQDIGCAFNDLVDARVGDIAQITAGTARLTYRVERIGLGSKAADTLPGWAANSTIADRVVLVTCQYRPDGASPDNLIVVAHLTR
jgi:sortase (surface protein transpeptidase)